MTLQDFCSLNDICIVYRSFTTKVKGFTMPDDEGNMIIVINERFCPESQKATLEHELLHVLANHFQRPEDTAELELEVHKVVDGGFRFRFSD